MPEQLGLFGSFPCGGWSISNANLTSNSTAVLAPDGTATADDVTSTAAGAYLQDVVANPAQYDNATLTASVYLCVPSGTPSINLHIYNQNPSGITAIATQSVALSSTWQRFSLTGTAANGLMKLYLQIGDSTSFPSGETVYVWGAQMVRGSSAGAPIQTVNTTTSDANGATVYLAANGMNESYSYDPFGNMVSSGNFTFQQAYTTANQLVGWNYDASGNLLTDAFNNSITYDAEGRLSRYAGNNYVYDADGNRVEKNGSSTTDYIYFGGQQLARLSAGQWTDLIYGPTGLLAEVPGTQTGSPVYRMLDQLGTQVGTLSSTGVQLSSTDYAPFGQLFAGGTTDPYQFTGKERDSESGNDYFGARYFGSSMGRFMSPDPSGLLAQRPEDPQSWNMYAYSRNNPLIFIDPSGLDCIYATDNGKGVESIDHRSRSSDCGDSGGTWLSGYVDEKWAHYNKTAKAFEAASEDGSQVNFAQFQAGAQTNDSGGCLSGCGSYGFASTSADFMTGQLVGNSRPTDGSDPLDGLLTFMTKRDQAVTDFWKGVAGPINGKDNWAGPGGMGPPQGTGDWRAAVHDYNLNTNGITIGSYFNPHLSPATSRALIQSNNNLMRTGGVQGAKEKMTFGVINAFQWYADSWK